MKKEDIRKEFFKLRSKFLVCSMQKDNQACFGYERLPTTNSETNQIVYLGIGMCIKKNIALVVQALSSETKNTDDNISSSISKLKNMKG